VYTGTRTFFAGKCSVHDSELLQRGTTGAHTSVREKLEGSRISNTARSLYDSSTICSAGALYKFHQNGDGERRGQPCDVHVPHRRGNLRDRAQRLPARSIQTLLPTGEVSTPYSNEKRDCSPFERMDGSTKTPRGYQTTGV
jgi:hypothetical protein